MENEGINYSDYVYYDESSPTCLRWKVDHNYKKKGSVAGSLSLHPVPMLGVNKKYRSVARVVWYLCKGSNPKKVYHIDSNPLNNKLANLSLTYPSIHNKPKKKPAKNSSTGLLGVSFGIVTGILYCVASWTETSGRLRLKRFSVKRLGIMQATKEAVEARRVGLSLGKSI